MLQDLWWGWIVSVYGGRSSPFLALKSEIEPRWTRHVRTTSVGGKSLGAQEVTSLPLLVTTYPVEYSLFCSPVHPRGTAIV